MANEHEKVNIVGMAAWTAFDRQYFKLENVFAKVPMTTHERAYTSPIWYTPQP